MDQTANLVFDALLLTGWDVDVDNAGNINAARNQVHIHGSVCLDGSIEWDGSLAKVGYVLQEARIQALQRQLARHKALHTPADTRPDLSQ